MKLERRQHIAEINDVRATAAALQAQLSEVHAAQREEEDGVRRQASLAVRGAQDEAERVRGAAEADAALRQREVQRERERREEVEQSVGSLQMQLAAAEAKAARHLALAQDKVSGVEERHAALKAQLQAQQLNEQLTQAQSEASASEKQKLLRRVEEAEAARHGERREAELTWHDERTRLQRRIDALSEHVRLVEDEQAAAAEVHREQSEAAMQRHALEASVADRDLAAMREAVRIANLAAEIAAEARDKELSSAHAAMAAAKRSVLSRLDSRWDGMILRMTWQAWCLVLASSRGGAQRIAQRSAAAGQSSADRPRRGASFKAHKPSAGGGGSGGGDGGLVRDEAGGDVRAASVGRRSISFSFDEVMAAADSRSGSRTRSGLGAGLGAGLTSGLAGLAAWRRRPSCTSVVGGGSEADTPMPSRTLSGGQSRSASLALSDTETEGGGGGADDGGADGGRRAGSLGRSSSLLRLASRAPSFGRRHSAALGNDAAGSGTSGDEMAELPKSSLSSSHTAAARTASLGGARATFAADVAAAAADGAADGAAPAAAAPAAAATAAAAGSVVRHARGDESSEYYYDGDGEYDDDEYAYGSAEQTSAQSSEDPWKLIHRLDEELKDI